MLDLTVTGVQTCALPFTSGEVMLTPYPTLPEFTETVIRIVSGLCAACASLNIPRPRTISPEASATFTACRSEERRVGKECRSWWQQEQMHENARRQTQ